MLSALFKPAKTRTILFISLSNIGDVVLTFPVFDALCEAYPQALFSVVVSPKGKPFFEAHPRVKTVYILEKHSGIRDKVRWLRDLRREKFDLVVDLRNSLLPFLARARRRTRPVLIGEVAGHMRDKHLRRLSSVLKEVPLSRGRHVLHWFKGEVESVDRLLMGRKDFVVIAPGAADVKKCWTSDGFSKLVSFLIKEPQVPVVVVGDRKDAKTAAKVLEDLPGGVLNICGMTNLKELALILCRARLVVVNDSGIMHLASYQNVPTIALFGPTDPLVYGPWGKGACVVRSFSGRMMDIDPQEVLTAVSKALK